MAKPKWEYRSEIVESDYLADVVKMANHLAEWSWELVVVLNPGRLHFDVIFKRKVRRWW